MRTNLICFATVVALTAAFVAVNGCAAPPVDASAVDATTEALKRPEGPLPWRERELLAAAWWRWAFELPDATHHPFVDQTGADCMVGQNDRNNPVRFLVGSLDATPVTRRCTIPPMKKLFFPLITYWADNVGVNPPYSAADNQAYVTDSVNAVTGLRLEIDGRVVGAKPSDFASARAATQLTYVVPDTADNFYRALFQIDFSGPVTPPTLGPTFVDGYWISLPPLSAGRHTIHFTASTEKGLSQDVTYELTVAGDHR